MDPVLAYHERTKHSYGSVRTGGHTLDWANEPSKFKRYLAGEPIPLPEPEPSGVAADQALERSARGDGEGAVDLGRLSHLLFHAAGVVRTVRGAIGTFHFRTYASAGALYPNEVYVAAADVQGLEPGLYHYEPQEHRLRRLRDGDVRGALGLAGEPAGAIAVAVTGIPWRTAWKYTARGFRHLYWDAGMIVANLLGAAGALGVRARLVLGFVDERLDPALGVDGTTEFGLCVVTLGDGPAAEPTEVPALRLDVAPRSPGPPRDPAIEQARAAVALGDEAEVERFRAAPVDRRAEEGPAVSLSPEQPSPRDGFERVVRRRGSSRRLARAAVPASEFAAILARATAGVPADRATGLVRALLVANALDGLAPGAYAADGGFRLLREGDLRAQAGYLCLEQRLGADAAATTFVIADLEPIVAALGGRGYAAALLEAGVVAGRMYLGAYARCLGASGITFYDDEVRSLFGTDAEPLIAVVVGEEGRRASIRRCRERLRDSSSV
ncbi:MAG TPA: SagB family peptide dehydrogenase [Actinomycetota bacterium]|nr:SagB family peptide dehydrogenase [Actinomycetota bacterium]